MRSELAVKLAEQGNAVGETKLRTRGGERRIFRRRRAVDDEDRTRKRLEHRHERGIAHPVVRPGEPRAQRQRGLGVEQQQTIEAPAQLAPGIGRVARINCLVWPDANDPNQSCGAVMLLATAAWLAKAREKRKNACRFGVHSENLGYVYFLY